MSATYESQRVGMRVQVNQVAQRVRVPSQTLEFQQQLLKTRVGEERFTRKRM